MLAYLIYIYQLFSLFSILLLMLQLAYQDEMSVFDPVFCITFYPEINATYTPVQLMYVFFYLIMHIWAGVTYTLEWL